jgi:plastocyanin
MNTKIIIGVVIAVVVLGGAVFFLKGSSSQMNMQKMPVPTKAQTQTSSTTPVAAAKNTITIQGFAFSPATLTVKVGDKVTWTNQDSVGHSATADDNSFDTGVLAQGQSGSITFSKAGTYTYHCSVHPNMKATIIVQ